MTGSPSHGGRRAALHVALVTLALLLVPLLAMRFTDQVRWSPMDFLVAGCLMFAAGFSFAQVLRATRRPALRLAFGLALAGAWLLVWANLAVGMVASPGNPANFMVAGVLAVGLAGTLLARLRPRGMALAMLATALALVLAAGLALSVFAGAESTRPDVVLVTHGFFAALFLASAWLFRRAARPARDAHGNSMS
jgi:hypothetical protein